MEYVKKERTLKGLPHQLLYEDFATDIRRGREMAGRNEPSHTSLRVNACHCNIDFCSHRIRSVSV